MDRNRHLCLPHATGPDLPDGQVSRHVPYLVDAYTGSSSVDPSPLRIYALTLKNKIAAAFFCAVTIPQLAIGIYLVSLAAIHPGRSALPNAYISAGHLSQSLCFSPAFTLRDRRTHFERIRNTTSELDPNLGSWCPPPHPIFWRRLTHSYRHTPDSTGPLSTLRVREGTSHRNWIYLYLTLLR
jgi:hypothetical protein